MSQIDVIKEVLNKTADCCKEAIPYLEYVEGISYDVEQMASSIILVEKYTKDLDESVTVLTDVCYALAAIPIVGVVASKVPDVLKPIKVPLKALHNVATESKPILETVKTSTKELSKQCAFFKKDATFASSHFKNYANSLDVLNACLELLGTVSELISNESIKQKLNNITDDLDNEMSSISNDILEVQQKIQLVKDDINHMNNEFYNAFKPFLNAVNTISKGCQSISSFVSPITNAFNKVINAISPLKWLLKAFSWVFNKIVNPIIDKILGWLGINALLNKITHKIEEILHVDEISERIHNIENEISQDVINEIISTFDRIQNKLNVQYDKLTHLLSLDDFEDDVINFLEESYKEFSEQELPDWPFDDALINIDVHSEYYIPTKCQLTIKGNQEQYINVFDRELIDSYEQSINGTISELDSLVNNINTIYNEYSNLYNKMIICQKYSQDIMLYESLAQNLKVCLDSFKDFTYFDEVNTLISKIDIKIDNEKEKLSQLNDNMAQCLNFYSELYNQFNSLYLTLPNQQNINSLYSTLLRVEESFFTVNELISNSKVEDGVKLHQKIDTQFENYMIQVKLFQQKVDEIDANINHILSQINNVELEIEQLSQGEYEIIDSKFFKSISLVNQYLRAIYSIMQPGKQIISFILKKENSQNEEFMLHLKSLVNKISKCIENILATNVFNEFIDMVLPFDVIDQKIDNLNELLIKIDYSTLSTLQSEITYLQNLLQPTLSYKDENGDEVFDLYMDQNMYDKLNAEI